MLVEKTATILMTEIFLLEEKLDLNDISFDDIVATDNTLVDTVPELDASDSTIKEAEPEAVELTLEDLELHGLVRIKSLCAL